MKNGERREQIFPQKKPVDDKWGYESVHKHLLLVKHNLK